jgi:molybdopterin-containing oxidoreductase family membrane subunit
MIEKALSGDRKYWTWVVFLLAVMGLATWVYYRFQFQQGLTVTGLGRDVTWGFVLPYYLHNWKAFGKITILGEFIAISSVIMCMLFVFVDLGKPMRIMNMPLNPSPNSLLFWDMIVLSGYLLLNVAISKVMLSSEFKGIAPPKWIKPIIIISIPWAVSIHTVTAFLYSGLAARPFWMSAILAPRFLASAFATGPALLILLCLLLKKLTKFDVGKEPIQKLAVISCYALLASIFFILMEFFTALYSDIPEHVNHFKWLFVGLDGHGTYVSWMWISSIMAVVAALLLVIPKARQNDTLLVWASIFVVVSLWIEKGMTLVVAGFIPTVLGYVVDYVPTLKELIISAGIYALGLLLITVFYKVTLAVRHQLR